MRSDCTARALHFALLGALLLVVACGDSHDLGDGGADAIGLPMDAVVDAPIDTSLGDDVGPRDVGRDVVGEGLVISPTPYVFPETVPGTLSAAQRFTVRHGGAARSGPIAIALAGVDATHFELGGVDTCSGHTFPPGGECIVDVVYAPTAYGEHTAELQASDAVLGTGIAVLIGRAFRPCSSGGLVPSFQDFGTVTAGSSSATVDFTLTSFGSVATAALSHSFGGIDATEFGATTSTCAGVTLAGGDTCTITVRFDAGAPLGVKTATLDVTDGVCTVSASLTAISSSGEPGSFRPSTHDFGLAAVGTMTSPFIFTIDNPGGSATGVLTADVVGANAADFPIGLGGDSCTGVSLSPGASCTVAVQFAPSVAGPRAATLRVSVVAGFPITAALSGTGIAP